jgi:ribosomal protein S18 acetylase RimI-like enzyme
MEAAYAEAGVDRFAAWIHESDEPMRLELERRDYVFDTSTRAMWMALDEIRLPRPELDLHEPDWEEYLRTFDLPAGLLSGDPHPHLRVLVARLDGHDVATAMAFDHAGDSGIYNVVTLEHARRRGLGTALTAFHLHDAVARGCRTASVQSTPMAERVYAAAGFRDLGRFFQYVPARSAEPRDRPCKAS